MTGLTKKNIAGFAVFLGVVCLGASLYVSYNERTITTSLSVLIAEQETTLAALSELIDRDGADAVVSAIVKDCTPTERDRFDILLGSLATIKTAELKELDSLFSACGNYFTQRKAVMVARLEREVEVYASYVTLLGVVDSRVDTVSHAVDSWQQLVELERERSRLASQLVSIQRSIIDALLAGSSPTSDEIKMLLGDANEAREQVTFVGMQIDTLREGIFDL